MPLLQSPQEPSWWSRNEKGGGGERGEGGRGKGEYGKWRILLEEKSVSSSTTRQWLVWGSPTTLCQCVNIWPMPFPLADDRQVNQWETMLTLCYNIGADYKKQLHKHQSRVKVTCTFWAPKMYKLCLWAFVRFILQ